MNEEAIDIINRMRAITISREYGSGGGEIAARLAKLLGWQLIDHTIVEHVASELGTSLEEAKAHDEQGEGMITRLLNSMQCIYPTYTANLPSTALPLDEVTYCKAVNKIVRAAAARGHVVIVGRASQMTLAKRRDVLHVRIIAPFEQRVASVMQREGLARHSAEVRIRSIEHERASYLEREYHHKPDEAGLYDLILNTSRLDPESAVTLLCFTLHEIAEGLATNSGELGPATGLAR